MNLIDKAEKYLTSRKTPVTVSQLADRFMVHRTSIHHALNRLAKKRKVVVLKVGPVNWYRVP